MSSPIYEPKGKAKEYADYALNIYKGCPHNCGVEIDGRWTPYCFAPLVLRKDRVKFQRDVLPRANIVEDTKRQLASWSEQGIADRLIELCFTCDPFPYGYDHEPTFEIIRAIKESGNHVKILTKNFSLYGRAYGGFGRLVSMLDKNDWFGCSYDGSRELYTDVLACSLELNTAMLYMHMHTNTWVSFEPVVDAEEVLREIEVIAKNKNVDAVKIGKLNYVKSDINWGEFGRKAEELCQKNNLNYYIKESLREEMNNDKAL